MQSSGGHSRDFNSPEFKPIETVIDGLKRLYKAKIKPLEAAFKVGDVLLLCIVVIIIVIVVCCCVVLLCCGCVV